MARPDLSEQEVRELLERAQTIAVVGASNASHKAASYIPRQLMDVGFDVIPVNPAATEVHGVKAYPTLADVPVPIDIVDVFRPGEEAAQVARQAVQVGAGAVWLQLGITSAEAKAVADEAGVAFIQDRCIGPTVRQFGITKRRP